MAGTIKSQLNHAISRHLAIGESKKATRREYGDTQGKIFSCKTADALRATANQFAGWLRDHHPEVVKVRQIRDSHVQEWMDQHFKAWSDKTKLDKLSNMRGIISRCEDIYPGMRCDMSRVSASYRGDKIRDVHIDPQDIKTLIRSYIGRAEGGSNGCIALQLTYRLGLRSDELSRPENRSDSIDLDQRVVHLVGKNGKWRDVPIRERDMPYMAHLKERLGPDAQLVHNVRAESLNRSIRREMERVDIAEKYHKTTLHAVRKTYARERMQEERDRGLTERQAWEIVQKELGHGERFRQALYDAYIGRGR